MKKHGRIGVVFAGILALLASEFMAISQSYADWEPPPPPKPQRRKAGESFPPLPLPATPLRRTEKKRPPAPPALIGKIQYGKPIWKTTSDGRRFSYLDWRSDKTDIYNLLKWANKKLGIRYRGVELQLSGFSYSPSEVPILYMSGHENFVFSDKEREGLRWFVRDGGYLVGDACCGARNFSLAFMREVKTLFPDRPMRKVAPDHPLFSCYYEIKSVQHQDRTNPVYSKLPDVKGMSLGCRTAVVLYTHDVSCGWAGHKHPEGLKILPEDALKLGTNLVTYALANYQLGKFLSTRKMYYEQDEQTREEFVFGQIIHGGDWDPDPSAVVNLLKSVRQNSALDVQFKRGDIDLRKVDAFRYPFLYMTGHHDFKLTDDEVSALRSYLSNGGVLLSDACCGRESFDQAFRREIGRVLTKSKLQKLSVGHPIFSSLYTIRNVRYTDMLRQNQPDLTEPHLEGITIGGVLAVIYSKYDLGCGWEGQVHPYSNGYSSADALKLASNIIVYAMTH